MVSFPAHYGMNLTSTIHSHASGPTDPTKIQLPSPFVVCVTGAGKGLGFEIAVAYARADASGIVISSRTQTDLDKLTKALHEANPKVVVLAQTCDTQKDDEVRALADATKKKFGGRLDVVVANAGIFPKYVKGDDGKNHIPVGISEEEDFERVVETNLVGSWRVAKYFVPLLEQSPGGKEAVRAFVGITSVSAHMHSSQVTPFAYNLTKIDLNRMIEHIHNDYEAKNIQAFAVHPGAILTAMTEKHRTTQMGEAWNDILTDDVGLCGGFLTWLTSERRQWLSGRYLSVTWDTEQLCAMKDDIVEHDKLKFRMVV